MINDQEAFNISKKSFECLIFTQDVNSLLPELYEANDMKNDQICRNNMQDNFYLHHHHVDIYKNSLMASAI